ncbi:hypothetical protein HUW62_29055 [Myxococcus sp. AM011]|uniref:hypothetical protein n=1 Tax=Myxococcus sp. AM011 TaxID=2745200 RepID=UPI001594F59E|nr:hypothetical protein [Myxococcus sp. AM011]NVJ25281.1 hypothetical protein [Myxococcus sp. AM011]
MNLWIAIAAGLSLAQGQSEPPYPSPTDPSVRDPAASALRDANEQAAEEADGAWLPPNYVIQPPMADGTLPYGGYGYGYNITPVLPDGEAPSTSGQVAVDETYQRYEPIPAQVQEGTGGSGTEDSDGTTGDDGTSTGVGGSGSVTTGQTSTGSDNSGDARVSQPGGSNTEAVAPSPASQPGGIDGPDAVGTTSRDSTGVSGTGDMTQSGTGGSGTSTATQPESQDSTGGPDSTGTTAPTDSSGMGTTAQPDIQGSTGGSGTTAPTQGTGAGLSTQPSTQDATGGSGTMGTGTTAPSDVTGTSTPTQDTTGGAGTSTTTTPDDPNVTGGAGTSTTTTPDNQDATGGSGTSTAPTPDNPNGIGGSVISPTPDNPNGIGGSVISPTPDNSNAIGGSGSGTTAQPGSQDSAGGFGPTESEQTNGQGGSGSSTTTPVQPQQQSSVSGQQTGNAQAQDAKPTATDEEVAQLKARLQQVEEELKARDTQIEQSAQATQQQVDTFGERAVDTERSRQQRLSALQSAGEWMLAADAALQQGEDDVGNALDIADSAFADLRDSAAEFGQGTVIVHAERARALLNLARDAAGRSDTYSARLALQDAGVELSLARGASLGRSGTGNSLLSP